MRLAPAASLSGDNSIIDLERIMTLTEATTRTLDVPGATLTYDVRPNDSSTEPPLFLIGSPMGAAGFGTLAGHFTDRTVVTYDPRGAERSPKAYPTSPSRPDDHADDLHRIIQEIGGGPVDLFASSGGAVNALALVATHPEVVRILVAHEPPLASILSDSQNAKATVLAIQNSYQTRGFGAGMAHFMAVTSHRGPFPDDFASRRHPIQRCSGCRPRMTAAGPMCCSDRTSSVRLTTSRTSTRCGRRRPGSSSPPAPSRRARWRTAAPSPSPSGSVPSR
jgi:pimeloyl-ACP methyl ester carboxylesterase